MADGHIEGTGRLVEQKRDLKWEASRQQTKNSPPRTHTFEPAQFHHFFSDAIEPALGSLPGTDAGLDALECLGQQTVHEASAARRRLEVDDLIPLVATDISERQQRRGLANPTRTREDSVTGANTAPDRDVIEGQPPGL